MRSSFIAVNENIFETLLAISEVEQQRGLMHQKFPPPIMTFVYGSPVHSKFWMKNTPSPLEIIFCKQGKVIHIANGVPFSEELVGPESTYDLVVEMPSGFVQQFDIKLNDNIKLVR